MKKFLIIIIVILLSISFVYSVEIGLIMGNTNRDTGLNVGLSIGMGMLIPMLKVEYELLKNPNVDNKTVTTGIKLKPKFGTFSPYALIGVGTDFEKFSLEFKSYNTFSFYGGGLYIYFGKIFSVRFDLRFLNYKTINKTRVSGGIFINI